MSEPSVCAVMLTRDRPAMAARAVRAFEAQTYQRKHMIILDTGAANGIAKCQINLTDNVFAGWHPKFRGESIGELRNRINGTVAADIIIHWDDDDWSDPNRIAHQVHCLQKSGVECFGYNEMPFWDARKQETWMYSNGNPAYCLGTSMCYWRSTWERVPFEDKSNGCDDNYWTLQGRVKSFAKSAIYSWETPEHFAYSPLMIASIHGGNSASQITPGAREWQRFPMLDAYCKEKMA